MVGGRGGANDGGGLTLTRLATREGSIFAEALGFLGYTTPRHAESNDTNQSTWISLQEPICRDQRRALV